MTSTQVQKYKNKSYKVLHRLAKEYFHLFIRLRDTDENGFGRCIVTGQPLRFGTRYAQAGHYYAAGKYKTLEFNEDNVHLQSLQDNYYGHDFPMYTQHLKQKIGIERFEKLEFLAASEKQHGFKEDRFTIIDIIETYKEKCKVLIDGKNFEV